MPYILNKFQRQFIDDLKAGRFAQGVGFLGTEHTTGSPVYCCLGVACLVYNELAEQAGLERLSVRMYLGGVFSFDEQRYSLPLKVLRELKFRSNDGGLTQPYVRGDSSFSSLDKMNDGDVTHQEIAAHIEANPEHVFH